MQIEEVRCSDFHFFVARHADYIEPLPDYRDLMCRRAEKLNHKKSSDVVSRLIQQFR